MTMEDATSLMVVSTQAAQKAAEDVARKAVSRRAAHLVEAAIEVVDRVVEIVERSVQIARAGIELPKGGERGEDALQELCTVGSCTNGAYGACCIWKYIVPSNLALSTFCAISLSNFPHCRVKR